MGTSYFSKKLSEHIFGKSEASEEQSRWKSTKSGKKKYRFGDSSVDNYKFLESFAGGMESKRTKLRNETVIVDEAVKERIFQSDAALQSSSSNYNSKTLSGCRFSDHGTSNHGESFNASRSSKSASDSTGRLCLADNEPISIISDEENDNSSTMSSNGLADAEGSSGERVLEHEITSHEMDSSVVVHPEYVIYGRRRYGKAKLTFFCSFIKLDVSEEEGPTGSLTFEWKTLDLISIESRWLDPFKKAAVCLYIKPEHPELTASQKLGILEVKFVVCDPYWTNTQEGIQFLDEQYEEKWDVDLDSYDAFEDVTYLEGNCGSISISERDFQLLQPEKFINDTIVDFYIEYLKKKMKPADERIHFFNSFFFRKLADFDENQLRASDAEAAFHRVRKWTKKVNIFQKDYIFIPVNFRLHWSLIVICHPGEVVNFEDEELENSLKVPCILHMDSIKGSHRGLECYIRCYLWEEWKERSRNAAEDISTKFMNLRFLRLEVPQQQNSYDCGLFMLHYIELFVKQAPINFNPMTNFISKDWFYPTEASLKRTRIKRLISELAENKSQQVSSPVCKDGNEEAEVEFLHEKYNSKETCVNGSRNITPLMVEPLRSEPMDVNLSNGAGILMSSSQELQSNCEEFPQTGNNGQLLIADPEQNHGQLVPYDPSNVGLSPIKGSDKTEDVLGKQGAVAVNEPLSTNAETNRIDSFMSCIDKSLNLLQLKENYPSEQHLGCCSSSPSGEDVREALIVEDSDKRSSPSSSDDVFETCVVVDSDSDDSDKNEYSPCYRGKLASSDSSSLRKNLAGNRLNVQASKRRKPVVSEARKRPRNSSSDSKVISLCE